MAQFLANMARATVATRCMRPLSAHHLFCPALDSVLAVAPHYEDFEVIRVDLAPRHLGCPQVQAGYTLAYSPYPSWLSKLLLRYMVTLLVLFGALRRRDPICSAIILTRDHSHDADVCRVRCVPAGTFFYRKHLSDRASRRAGKGGRAADGGSGAADSTPGRAGASVRTRSMRAD